MGNDLVKFEDQAAMAEYIGSLTDNEDTELQELRAEANPFDLMPKLVLSKDTKEIRAVHNDETVATFGSKNQLLFIPILLAESRALWRPDGKKKEGQDDKLPVCSTDRSPIGTFRKNDDRGIGHWRLEGNDDLEFPDADYEQDDFEQILNIKCSTCAYNKFESQPLWDPKREEGKGKACGEGRLIIGYIGTRIATLENGLILVEYETRSQMVYAQLPATSIKAIRGMGTACVSRNVPSRYTCFILGNDPKTSGQLQWGELTQEFAGFVSPAMVKSCDQASQSIRDMVFLKDLGPDISERSVESEVLPNSAGGAEVIDTDAEPEYGF